jgi:hypothetical protein
MHDWDDDAGIVLSTSDDKAAAGGSTLMSTPRGAVVGVVLLIAFLAWCNPFVGSEANHIASDNVLSKTSWRTTFGSKKVFARAGQTIELKCDATVEQGYLEIRVWRNPILPRPLGESPLTKLSIDSSGGVERNVPIRETGFYRIDISPWRDAGRYDISYDLTWRVR